jgi:hypothetical protein
MTVTTINIDNHTGLAFALIILILIGLLCHFQICSSCKYSNKEVFATINPPFIGNTYGRTLTIPEPTIKVPKYNIIQCDGPSCNLNQTGPYPLPCDKSNINQSVFVKCTSCPSDEEKSEKSIKDMLNDPETRRILMLNKYITGGLDIIRQKTD